MSKSIFFVIFLVCASLSAFSQKTGNQPLSERIVKAIEQNLPAWTISQRPKLAISGGTSHPEFDLRLKDNENRDVNIRITFMEEPSERESRFRFFFIRAIMPTDSSKIENFVEKGFLVGTGDSVEALFSKANLVIDIYSKFQPKQKDRKTPSYYLPAPQEEKDKTLKLVETIAKTIEGDAGIEECRNTFFKYSPNPNETPENRLLIAVANGDAAEVSEILRQNVDPNTRIAKDLDFASASYDQGNTALHFAARQGCGETVRALIAAKSDVNAVNGRGETPLMFAANRANAEGARLLLDAGADVQMESYNQNAAFYAVRAKQNPVLLNSLTDRKEQKMTENARAILKALAARGLDLKKKEPWNGDTLLTALLSTARGKFAYDLTEMLLGYGVDPNESNKNGVTPLSILANAVSSDTTALMKLLISKGADVNKPGKDNQTPLRDLLRKQAEYKQNDEYAKYVNEAIAVLVNAGAKKE